MINLNDSIFNTKNTLNARTNIELNQTIGLE